MGLGPKFSHSLPSSGLRELLNGIFYGYRELIFVFLFPIVTAVLLSTVTQTIYSSDARYLVLLSRQHILGEGLSTAGFGGSLNMQSRIVRAEAEILMSRDLRHDVVRQIGPTVMYPGVSQSELDVNFNSAEQEATDLLERDLVINLSASSDVVHLQYEHSDPNVAADVVNAVLDTYLRHRAKVFSSDAQIVLEDRLAKFEAVMADLDFKIAEQRRNMNIYDYAVEKQTLLRRMAELTNKKMTSEIAIEGLAARSSELEELKKLIPEEVEIGGSDDGVLTALNRAIDNRNSLQLKRIELSNTYKSDSRFIKDISARIDEADRIVRELEEAEVERRRTGRNSTYDRVVHEIIGLLAQLRSEEAIWEENLNAIESVGEQLALLEVAETEFNQFMLERAIVIEKIKTYETRLEKERLAGLLENQYDDPTIRIIERAVPAFEGKNSGLQIIAIGILCGFIFSAATIYIRSISRTILVTPEEAERAIEIPVLVSIGLKE